MFLFMFCILFEVLAYVFLGWFGKYGDERSFMVDICLVDICCGYSESRRKKNGEIGLEMQKNPPPRNNVCLTR